MKTFLEILKWCVVAAVGFYLLYCLGLILFFYVYLEVFNHG